MSEQTGAKRPRGTATDAATPGPTSDGSARAAGNGSGPMDAIRAEVDRAKATVDDVKAELAAATSERRGGPATSVEDAATKSESLRRAIDRDIAALRSRVPETDAVSEKARTVGLAVGGGVLTLVGVVAVMKRWSARRGRDQAVREQASAIARELARIERGGGIDPDGDGGHPIRWLLLGTVAAGAGAYAWNRSREQIGIDDVFGAPEDDPLRPPDVVQDVADEVER